MMRLMERQGLSVNERKIQLVKATEEKLDFLEYIIVIGQQQEPGVEHHLPVVIFHHGSFLVIDEHGFHAAAKVAEASHQ